MTAAGVPHAMLDLRSGLGDAVARLEQRAGYAAVLLSSRGGISIEVEQAEERIGQLPLSAGSVVSCLSDGVLLERSVPGFDADQLDQAVHQLVADASGPARALPANDQVTPRDFSTGGKVLGRDLTLEDRLDRCRALQRRLARLDPRIVNTRVSYLEQAEASVFRSGKADFSQDIERLRITVEAILAENGEVRFDWRTKSGTAGWQALDFSDEELNDVVEGAARLFTAERIEPGDYQVVTGPGVSGTLAHESFGHGVETDLFPKERARAYDFVGRKVGSPIVDIIDDPSRAGAYSSYFFDDEGMPAEPTRIVEGGVFRRGISDMLSAAALGIPRTANGRRQDYTRKAYARMSNTYFGPGTVAVEDLFGQVDRGIFLDRWISGVEDPLGWGIQITCHYGREIRGGKLTDRVFSPVSLSGYVPQVLETIRAASPTVEMDPGVCGKGHKEHLPNCSGGPHLLLKVKLG